MNPRLSLRFSTPLSRLDWGLGSCWGLNAGVYKTLRLFRSSGHVLWGQDQEQPGWRDPWSARFCHCQVSSVKQKWYKFGTSSDFGVPNLFLCVWQWSWNQEQRDRVGWRVRLWCQRENLKMAPALLKNIFTGSMGFPESITLSLTPRIKSRLYSKRDRENCDLIILKRSLAKQLVQPLLFHFLQKKKIQVNQNALFSLCYVFIWKYKTFKWNLISMSKIKMKVAMKWIHIIRSSFVILESDILSKHAKRFSFDKLSLCDRRLFHRNIPDQLG